MMSNVWQGQGQGQHRSKVDLNAKWTKSKTIMVNLPSIAKITALPLRISAKAVNTQELPIEGNFGSFVI